MVLDLCIYPITQLRLHDIAVLTAEGKLLLRVYLPRPVVGHRVGQATALPSGGGAEAPFGVVAVADQVL